jgi:predicted phosphodiesterase
MPRTLVISDLHIGARRRSSVIEHPAPLERLLGALDGIERLVLLGDLVELLETRPQRALESALPVLRALGARLGSEREVVIVPGNHDRTLVRRWIRTTGAELRVQTAVPVEASPILGRIVAALRPARVAVSYPGVWLGDRVWATHGHYLDRHLWPVSAYGMVRGGRHGVRSEPASPWDYERSGRVHLSPVVRWLPDPLAALFDDLAELGRASTMPRLVHRSVLRPGLAPLTARLLGTQMRRHSLPALARVVRDLRVGADAVIFGHVHRVGPLAGDDLAQWRDPSGSARLLNTGSWLYEPLLVHRVSPPHPYWPGGAVLVGDGEPRALGLLDDLTVAELTGG